MVAQPKAGDVEIMFRWTVNCPHCEKELKFDNVPGTEGLAGYVNYCMNCGGKLENRKDVSWEMEAKF